MESQQPGGPKVECRGCFERGFLVLGPLPALHRLWVVGVVLVVGICAGAWIAHFTPMEVAAPAGALLGAAAGLLVGYLLVHDFSPGRHARTRGRSTSRS